MRRPLACALFVLWAVSGCERPPSADGLHDWTPTDHDRTDEKEKLQGGVQAQGRPAAPRGTNAGAGAGDVALIEATWKNQCLRCHGPIGHGDGPEGMMVKAADLTNGEWQDKTPDAEMVTSIKNGKNKMPKFDLPDAVVQGLVARIRASRGR